MKIYQKVLTAGVVLTFVACGGGSSKPTGTEEDRSDLSGAAGSSSSSGSDGAGGGATASLSGFALKNVALKNASETEKCDSQGTMTSEATITGQKESGDSVVVSMKVTGTATDCGQDHLTGSFTMTGDVTVNSKTGNGSGDLTMTMSGSSAKCTSMTGDLTAGIALASGVATVTINGSMDGTCSGGSTSCSFDNVSFTDTATDAQIKTKFCEACDVTAANCS